MTRISALFLALVLTGATPAPLAAPAMPPSARETAPDAARPRTVAVDVTPAPSAAVAAPTPSGEVGTALLGGFATYFDTCPDCAAAGPALRHALGAHWRGSLVDVASRYGSATLRLTDWCACRNREGLPTLLDVSVEAFNDLSSYPARSDRDPGYVAVSIEIAGPQDPADDRMRIEDGGPTPPPTSTED